MEIVVFALSALALILLFLALSAPLSARLGLPLPVVHASAGLAYGAGMAAFGFKLEGSALDTYDIWFIEQLALDGGSLLAIFLPPLLFEMALAVDVRRMLDEASAVLAMAVVAVVAATCAVGVAVWAASDISLLACLMLGAAVATTDPAAVISTFRQLGAPKRLLVLLEGESLLNDAAAIAIFAVLLGLAGAAAETAPLMVLAGFAYSFLGGAAVGLAASFLASRLYPVLDGSSFAETSLTMALAYGAYLLAEQIFGASGVVAVVCAGLATGSVGFVRMGPRNWRGVQLHWAQFGFWSSALILLIVSSLTPALLARLTWAQAALVAVVYLGAMGARAAMLFGALPLVERLSGLAPMEADQKALVLWGGVRGAVTLVLALSLTEVRELGDEAAVVGALAALFTLSTLFLNAATLAFVTRALGLDRLSPSDLALRESIASGAIEQVRAHVAEIAEERRFRRDALEEVDAALLRQRESVEERTRAEGVRIPFGEKLRLGLAILSGQEARLVREAFEDGAIGPRATNLMRLAADRIADGASSGGRSGYEAAAEAALQTPDAYRIAYWAYRLFGYDAPLRNAIEFRLTTLFENIRILRELDRFARSALPEMIGEDAAENLRGALKLRLDATTEEADGLSLQYPSYAAALERMLMMRAAIRQERRVYERLYRDGVIGPELMRERERDLDRREAQQNRPPRLDLTLSPHALIERTPIFADFAAEQRRLIAERLTVVLAQPGQTVLQEGARRSDLFFVVSGALTERAGEVERTLSNGAVFGETAFLEPGRRSPYSVVSRGFSRLLALSKRDVERILRLDDKLAARLRRRILASREAEAAFAARAENSGREPRREAETAGE